MCPYSVYTIYAQGWLISFIANPRYNTNDFSEVSPEVTHKRGHWCIALCWYILPAPGVVSVVLWYYTADWTDRTRLAQICRIRNSCLARNT